MVKKKEMIDKDRLTIQPIVQSCIFHYTNAGTLVGMLKNTSKNNGLMTFWASHTSYMNDPKEIEYGIEKMWEVLPDVERELSVPKAQRITKLNREELDKFISDRRIDENSVTNLYSVSFSKSFDSLPMWSMYGQNGNGICLGFDVAELKDFLMSKTMKYLEITYGIGEDIEDSQTVKNTMDNWKEYVKFSYRNSKEFFEENIDRTISNWQREIAIYKYMALLDTVPGNIKNPAYKYEEECRIYCRESDHKVFFRDRNGLLLPYVETELPLSALKLVAIGPTADKNRQMMSVAKLLKEKVKNFDTLTFYSSDIPYRP